MGVQGCSKLLRRHAGVKHTAWDVKVRIKRHLIFAQADQLTRRASRSPMRGVEREAGVQLVRISDRRQVASSRKMKKSFTAPGFRDRCNNRFLHLPCSFIWPVPSSAGLLSVHSQHFHEGPASIHGSAVQGRDVPEDCRLFLWSCFIVQPEEKNVYLMLDKQTIQTKSIVQTPVRSEMNVCRRLLEF